MIEKYPILSRVKKKRKKEKNNNSIKKTGRG